MSSEPKCQGRHCCPASGRKASRVAQAGDSAADGSGNSHRQCVVIADVAEFVTDNAGDFVRLSVLTSPVVAQTAACCGFHPVAKVLDYRPSIK
jgi:hypothetical protein